MTDFPATNNNQHAMWLLGLVRACGIEPSKNGDGLMIACLAYRPLRLSNFIGLELGRHLHRRGTGWWCWREKPKSPPTALPSQPR